MSVITIDCHYVEPCRCAAFLILEGDRAAFVDNNTASAVPLLMDALRENDIRPDQVEFAIVTHAHLDHSGGSAALLRECPNATLVAHPRAARHLIDPTRLVAGVKGVYGEQAFKQLFGEIEAVDEKCVRRVKDGETIAFGERTLTFIHTLGHAKHHMCIHDSGSNGVFTGDTFGVCYEHLQYGARPYITYAAVPTQFDPAEARNSVQKILDTGAEQVFLTHFGAYEDVAARAEQLLHSIDYMESIIEEACASGLTAIALKRFCDKEVRRVTEEAVRGCGLEWDQKTQMWLEVDMLMNAAGLVYAVNRMLSS